ncbi:MAG: hypothetical protein H0U86_12725 [Chloroflexi bacterium]|nr:hypothetical protein [Chloroflexota bacterium]
MWDRVQYLAETPIPVPPWVVAGIYEPPDDDIIMDTLLGFAYIFVRPIEDEGEGVLDLLGLQVVYRLDDRPAAFRGADTA